MIRLATIIAGLKNWHSKFLTHVENFYSLLGLRFCWHGRIKKFHSLLGHRFFWLTPLKFFFPALGHRFFQGGPKLGGRQKIAKTLTYLVFRGKIHKSKNFHSLKWFCYNKSGELRTYEEGIVHTKMWSKKIINCCNRPAAAMSVSIVYVDAWRSRGGSWFRFMTFEYPMFLCHKKCLLSGILDVWGNILASVFMGTILKQKGEVCWLLLRVFTESGRMRHVSVYACESRAATIPCCGGIFLRQESLEGLDKWTDRANIAALKSSIFLIHLLRWINPIWSSRGVQAFEPLAERVGQSQPLHRVKAAGLYCEILAQISLFLVSEALMCFTRVTPNL